MINSLFIFGAKYLYLAVIIIAIFYFIKQGKETQKKLAFFSIIVLPLSYITAKVAGLLYYDPRPFVQSGMAPLIPHIADNGFPSDHVLLCAAIAAIIYSFNKKISALAWLLTIFVGLSRIYVGVHHFADVAGSAIIVMVIYYLTKRLLIPILEKSKYYFKA